MSQSETVYAILFFATFPALWILAAVLDRFLPEDSRHHSPREAREQSGSDDSISRLRKKGADRSRRAATKSPAIRAGLR